MGKSNRIRSDRAIKKVSNPIKFKQKKGMPLWVKSFIAIVITVAVLATCAFGILSANGVIMRLRYPMRSDNFKISGNMMSYYYHAAIQSFQEQYSDYMSYFSLDTDAPLKDQVYGDATAGGYEASILGSFEGTWHDYFMNTASQQAKQILIYCEYAKANNIELEDADMTSINVNLNAMTSVAEMAGYSENAYISQTYGAGVNVKDVRKAMELSALAQKAMLAIQDKIANGITDDDIKAEYDANPKDFNVVDYSYYTVTVNYTDVAKELLGSDYTDAELTEKSAEVLQKYTEKINEAKAITNALKDMKSADEFNKHLYNYLANKYYTEAYDKLELAEDKLPEAAVIDTVKAKVLEAVVADVIADKDATDTAYTNNESTYTLYEQTVSEEFAKAIDKIKQDMFKSLTTDKGTYVLEKQFYVKDDEFLTWAFEAGRTAGETKTILSGDGAESDEITKNEGKFTTSVYFLTATQRPDETLTKNIAYMTFGSEATAKEAIAAFAAGTLSVDAFKAIGTEKSATANSTLENYVEGYLGLEAFDKWLYSADTTLGSYTKTPLAADESTYLVAYYYSDGEASWSVIVKSTIFNERYTELAAEVEATYTVTIKDKLLNKIGE